MDVSLITPAVENLLLSSLRSAITDVNGGMDPNTALTKRASENALGPELACRLVEAFNTSKTLNRLGNTTGEKRAETFALADRDAVVKGLYVDDSVEKSAEVVRYNDPSKVNFNKAPVLGYEKVAAAGRASLKTEHVKQSLTRMPANAIVAGRGFLKDVQNARDEYRMRIKKANEDIAGSLHEFVQTFKRADRVAMSPLKDVEERLSYHFGPIAKQALDLAWSQLPENIKAVEKRAEETPSTYVYPLSDDVLYKLGAALINDVRDAAELKAEFISFDKKASLVESHLKKQVNLLAGRGDIPVRSILNEKSADLAINNEPAPQQSAGATLGESIESASKNIGNVTNILSGGESGQAHRAAKSQSIPAIMPSEHEGALRSIKAKMMLNDLISNDPVISGYPAEDTINAYNQVAEMLPALSTQPLAMRGLLSSLLQRGGGLEALEVKGLLDTENEKRKLRVLGD